MKNARKRIDRAFGTTEGPLGFNMTSKAAQAVEEVLKSQPKELRELFKCNVDGESVAGYCRQSFTPDDVEVKAADDGDTENWDVSTITTSALDRDGEVVLASGVNFKNFLKAGGVVSFAHQHATLPVGRAAWVTRAKSATPRKDGWIAKTLYYSRPKTWTGDWLPDAVFHMLQSGGMKGKSLGFLPLEGRRPEEKDLRARPELAKAHFIITKAEVVEYSVAPVPANADAVVSAVRKCFGAGLKFDLALLEKSGILIPGLVNDPVEDDDVDEVVEQTYEQVFKQARKDYTKALKGIDLAALVENEVLKFLGRY